LRDGEDLVLTASAGHGRRPHGERIPIQGSTSGEVMKRGVPERVSDVRTRLRISPEQIGVTDARAALLVPLVHRGESLGVLIAFDREADALTFTDDDEQLLKAFAASAATAVATAQSVQQQRLKGALAAAEAERRRWAQELHDETLQALGALRVLLASARRDDNPERLRAAADQAIEEIEQEITNLNAIITELRPAALDELGLGPALDALFDRHRTVNDLDIRADLSALAGADNVASLDADQQAAIYRLMQEALTNIAKHAHASVVNAKLELVEASIRAEVSDDGVGFAVDAARGGGFGLTGMRERVLMAGGELTIESSADGTSVVATLPLVQDATGTGESADARLSA
jgi:signal transduction histidine kinase